MPDVGDAAYDPPAGPIARAVARGLARLAQAVQPAPSDFGWHLSHHEDAEYRREYAACCQSYAAPSSLHRVYTARTSFSSTSASLSTSDTEHDADADSDRDTAPSPAPSHEPGPHHPTVVASRSSSSSSASSHPRPSHLAPHVAPPHVHPKQIVISASPQPRPVSRPSDRRRTRPRIPVMSRIASWSARGRPRSATATARSSTAPADPSLAQVALGATDPQAVPPRPSPCADSYPPLSQTSEVAPTLCGHLRRSTAAELATAPKPAKVAVKHKPVVRAEYNYFLAQQILVGADEHPRPYTSPAESLRSPTLTPASPLPSPPVPRVSDSEQSNRRLSLTAIRRSIQLRAPSLSPTLSPTRLDSAASARSKSSTATRSTSPPPTSSASRKRPNWAMRWSLDGRYVAMSGADGIITIFAVKGAAEPEVLAVAERSLLPYPAEAFGLLHPVPVRRLAGHTGAVLDLAWSKNGFLASCSSDRTLRLWHPKAANCLGVFSHADLVAGVAFHPRDERFILSASLDGRLLVWNIPARQVHYSTKVPGLLTAVSFSASGQEVLVGTFEGQVHLYRTDNLQHVATDRVARGKVTGIEPVGPDTVLVSANDSRIRLWNMRERRLAAPELRSSVYLNNQTQIRASLPPEGGVAVSGSEDGKVFLFDVPLDPHYRPSAADDDGVHPSTSCSHSHSHSHSKKQRDRQPPYAMWTASPHKAAVTVAAMAPMATHTWLRQAGDSTTLVAAPSRIVLTADAEGSLRVWRGDATGCVVPLPPDDNRADVAALCAFREQRDAYRRVGSLPISSPVLGAAAAVATCSGPATTAAPTSATSPSILPLRFPWVGSKREPSGTLLE